MNVIATPPFWQEALAHLRNDPLMATLIDRYPESVLQSRGDPFHTLSRAIVGQQVSVASADAVWRRLEAALAQRNLALSPQTILVMTDAELRECGFSRQKLGYMRNLAEFIIAEQCADATFWQHMSDAEVEAHITRIKGIGRWSAEMFLIFCLMRADSFPLADIGLQRAMHLHYGVGLKPFDAAHALAVAQQWQPYRSVALWYLWRSIDPSEVNY